MTTPRSPRTEADLLVRAAKYIDEQVRAVGRFELREPDAELDAGDQDPGERAVIHLREALAALAAPRSGGPEDVARRFHEAYERLAPSFGYETRRESAVPWEDVPENNRRLMIAVAAEVAAAPRSGEGLDVERLAEAMKRAQQAVAWTPEAVDIKAEYDALAPRSGEGLREAVAEAIYDAMREGDAIGAFKPWVPGGNSRKQDEARRRALLALAAPPREASEPPK